MRWKELHKIAVSGSRGFVAITECAQFLERYIAKNFPDKDSVVVIHGDALGVDSIIDSSCIRLGIKVLRIPARWLEFDKIAGPRRNQHIVDLCDEMFAFWDEKSPGTRNAIKLATEAGKLTKVFTTQSLRKELGVKLPQSIKVPKKAKNSQAKKLRSLIKEANLKDFWADLK